MPLIPSVNNRYSLLTDSVAATDYADKKTNNNLLKQLFNIKPSADKIISISNKAGKMEVTLHCSKEKFGIPLLFSISQQQKIIIAPERCRGILLTPSKDPNNKMGIDVKVMSDYPSG